jgi:hypothetical protein
MQSLSVKFDPNERSLRDVEKALAGYPAALQDKIVRNALRRWCKGTQQLAAAQTKKTTGKVARSLRVKVKAYDRGRVMWAAVGHGRMSYGDLSMVGGRAKRAIYDTDAGWRAHFVEFGFHQWSPQWSMAQKQRDVRRKRESRFGQGKGSGWRLGRYHRGRGTFYRGTEPLTRAGKVRASVLLPLIIAEVERNKQQLARAARASKGRP